MLDTTIHNPFTSPPISHPGSVPTYGAYELHGDSGYADEIEAKGDSENASDQSSNENGYIHGDYRPHCVSIAGSFNEQGLVQSMDMGIAEIIRRHESSRTLEMPISKETKSSPLVIYPEEAFSRDPSTPSTPGPLVANMPEEKELHKQGPNTPASVNLQKTSSDLESTNGQPLESNACSAMGSEKKLVLKTSLLPADPPTATIPDQRDEDDDIGAYEATPAPIHKLDSSASPIPDVKTQTRHREMSESSLHDKDLVVAVSTTNLGKTKAISTTMTPMLHKLRPNLLSYYH
jgi:hypothetical protein